jgi:hypothetical protein
VNAADSALRGPTAPPSRRSVRFIFGLIIVACWTPIALVVTGMLGVALYGGRSSGVMALVAPSDSSAVVLERLGPPTERWSDGQTWADGASSDAGCKGEPVGEAWHYDYWFANDALVIFDRAGRVRCIREGMFIALRSH